MPTPMTCGEKVRLTVAICTYNRANMLKECLTSLQQQTVSADACNLLIVDNNSTDNTHDTSAAFAAVFPSLRIVRETRQGLSHARNRAVKECSTEWIAFLDDDAKARRHWMKTLLDVIASGDYDAFGGPYYAWHRYGPPPNWLPPEFGTYEAKQGYGLLAPTSWIPGGNCAIRLAALHEAGSFSPDMGMRGNVCAYGEETQVFERMKRLGYRLGYVPALQIDHCVLPHKYSWRWQMSSAFARGRSSAALGYGRPLRQTPLFLWRAVRGMFKALYANMRTRGEKTPFARVAYMHVQNICWLLGNMREKLQRKFGRTTEA